MADNKKDTFPTLPAKQWWALRQKFKQSIPGVVTDNYLASVLNMQAVSAKNNILPSLRATGIIDQDGKTSDRARKWRDDTEYSSVCEEIRNQIYPSELLAVAPDRNSSRDTVLRWFMNYSGVGENAASKMASFYMLLLEADPEQGKEVNTQQANRQTKKPNAKQNGEKSKPIEINKSTDKTVEETKSRNAIHEDPPTPSINVNLQIHISSDASPEQIDKIFASMAKHIYNRRGTVINE